MNIKKAQAAINKIVEDYREANPEASLDWQTHKAEWSIQKQIQDTITGAGLDRTGVFMPFIQNSYLYHTVEAQLVLEAAATVGSDLYNALHEEEVQEVVSEEDETEKDDYADFFDAMSDIHEEVTA
jgi:hypothetical protein